MATKRPHRFRTISKYHEATGLPKPEHPLISVFNLESIKTPPMDGTISLVYDFYCISLKRVKNVRFKYGQQECDFDEGVLFFTAPGQVFSFEIGPGVRTKPSGLIVFFHPDLLWGTSLAKTIKKYEFFDYSTSEALYLSRKEEKQIAGIIRNIQQEYRTNIDKFSQDILVAQLEVLLSYSERFYQRQFITRKVVNHQILDQLEGLLTAWFDSDELMEKGLPTVEYVAGALHLSPGYLGSLLKTLTGQNTQQHIHEKLIAKAKEQLSTTDLSVSEIAYALGFEHTQSFSRLFKTKTNFSPLEFRQSFRIFPKN